MSNEAFWIDEAQADGRVGPAPMPTCGPDEIVVRIRAVSVNPIDKAVQQDGLFLTEYPAIIGVDGAGEVCAVGANVRGYAPGDHVISCFTGMLPPAAEYQKAAYQRYAVAHPGLSCKLPKSVAFSEAAVLPLAMISAADALFNTTGMQLSWPQVPPATPSGKTVVVWGASSSVGSCAVQLLVAAGYTVVAVAGAHNFDLCKTAGATQVFDHSSPTIVENIAEKLAGDDIAGILGVIVTEEALQSVVDLHVKLRSKGKAGSLVPPHMEIPCKVPEGLTVTKTHCGYVPYEGLALHLWGEWLPEAMANGTLKYLPAPVVVGKGLDKIQDAIYRQMKGVSGQKIVIDID
ncbi:NADPH:quinone reductase or related Zn-dependent oxidoreductase [Geosmithia morbida]|uniref:NADPH:quinone reductase or related Zn-dependent oxidoreductase n=1 Tax=Geosmithia morbida TaxID=1094350 RepID=A0A9P4Z1Y4_9HYPO|nr:NADPH:quinone reductase or related Zn-dependent oxidoreductase [Geosmithia morbida]KAF4126190.1 NADPH:quinone reductase or related Zn-dependent oxidoreductase [Geosmithia morbida]